MFCLHGGGGPNPNPTSNPTSQATPPLATKSLPAHARPTHTPPLLTAATAIPQELAEAKANLERQQQKARAAWRAQQERPQGKGRLIKSVMGDRGAWLASVGLAKSVY